MRIAQWRLELGSLKVREVKLERIGCAVNEDGQGMSLRFMQSTALVD